MADTPVPMVIILTNPALSGRALKAMVISRSADGSFAHNPDIDADVSIGDGQTTAIQLPLGARLVLREATDPPMPAAMAVHPAVTGLPPAAPLTPAAETRRTTLRAMPTRNPAETAELASLDAQSASAAAGMGALTPAAEARRTALRAQPTRSPGEDAELARLDAQSAAPAAPLTAAEEARRQALLAMPVRDPEEDAELAKLQARVR